MNRSTSNDDIGDAYRLIASNTALPGTLLPPRRLVERPPEPEVISRWEAARILATLQERAGRVALKPMPAVSGTPARGRNANKSANKC